MSEEEEEKPKEEEQENTDESVKDRNKREKVEVIERANKAAERMEKANEKHEELLEIQKDDAAVKALGGRAEAGTEPEKPKKLTDTEYAEALQRGEVNPLKEDGLI